MSRFVVIPPVLSVLIGFEAALIPENSERAPAMQRKRNEAPRGQ